MSRTKLTPQQINQEFLNGWILGGQTWTRESDNSFSEPIDATLKYQKGDKIRYKQGGTWKYQYIIGVGAYSGGKTIMTTTGGSDFVFTNGTAITDNYYSHIENPVGFPSIFACASPVWDTTFIDDGSGGQPTAGSTTFRISGGNVILSCSLGNPSYKVSANTLVKFTIPLTLPSPIGSGFIPFGSAIISANNYVGMVTNLDSTHMYLFSADSLADNLQMQATAFTATYPF